MGSLPNGRTHYLRLYEESDDARNGNWFILDNSIGNAFTPGSPLQIPAGYITGSMIARGTITGGPTGNIAIQTITGGIGGNIALNTITSDNIAQGTILGGPTGDIANLTITDWNIHDVDWSKITNIPNAGKPGGPPTGPAGGDLIGSSYPNPVVAPLAITNAKINDVAWAKVTGAPAFVVAPISAAQITSISWSQVTGVSVTRAQLAPNAPCGSPVSVAVPTGQTIPSATAWTTLVSLSITTRGGSVFLSVSACISATGPGPGANVGVRFLRDGSFGAATSAYLINSATYAAIPNLTWFDPAPTAAAHTYALQWTTETGCQAVTSSAGGGSFMAMEIG